MRDYIKYAGVLFVITLVTAILLGVVNKFTAPVIKTYEEEKTKKAIETVVEGKIDVSTKKSHEVDEDGYATEIISYKNDEHRIVYAVKSITSGYAGDIVMMVGVNSQGAVTGIEIISISETAGLGANARGNKEWLSQFLGKGNEDLDALTGATITSKAIQKGVNDAREQVMALLGGADVE